MTYDDIISSIEVMRMQEERTYSTNIWNYCNDDDDDDDSCFVVENDHDDKEITNNEHSSSNMISFSDPDSDSESVAMSVTMTSKQSQSQQSQSLGWNERFAIVQWCYRVADVYKLRRETVAIAMSFLDRFLRCSTPSTPMATSNSKNKHSNLRLATMACMNLATKLQEAGFHNGLYGKDQDVHEMELVISQSLGWRLHPPTSLDFVRQFLDLLRLTNHDSANNINHIYLYLLDQAKYQTELALYDCDLVHVNASSIAFGALWNSFDSLQADHDQTTTSTRTTTSYYLEAISKIAFLDYNQDSDEEIQFVRRRLYNLWHLNTSNDATTLQDDSSHPSTTTTTSTTRRKDHNDHHNNQQVPPSSVLLSTLLSQEKLKPTRESSPSSPPSLGEISPRSVVSKQA